MTQGRYYIVYEWMVELGLTMSETAAFALVFSYTSHGRSLTAGSDEYSRWICMSPRKSRALMARLVEKGLLVRTATRKGALTYYEYKTAPMFDKYIARGTKRTTDAVPNVPRSAVPNVPQQREETKRNNNQAHVRARATLQELMNGTRTDM